MEIKLILVTFLGKLVRFVSRFKGGGSALPGLVVERIDVKYLQKILHTLPKGVVVISGTNGKTTTTKMVVEILQANGLKVFTNSTGSNFMRGVISSLLSEVSFLGKLDADIAVLELDEAHATHFVSQVKPRVSLLLNVMRDQLDRFHELDYVAKLLAEIAKQTTGDLLVNREDPYLLQIAGNFSEKNVFYFGVEKKVKDMFLHGLGSVEDFGSKNFLFSSEIVSATIATVTDVVGKETTIDIGGVSQKFVLQARGIHNSINAAAAFALAENILGKKQQNVLASKVALENMLPAFGRGEFFEYAGDKIEILLVKNPAGFQLNIDALQIDPGVLFVAINDKDADGRDTSWLWNVDFSPLQKCQVDTVSGIRAWDMAVRLLYSDIEVRKVEPKISEALQQFLLQTKGESKIIISTYTAMLEIRKLLKKDLLV